MPGASPRALANTLIHPLARMLPQLRYQLQVYRLGEKQPPSGSMVGHAPHWAITQLLLDPLASQHVTMNLQPDFHWLATVASSELQGGSTTVVRRPRTTITTFNILEIILAVGAPNFPNQNWIELHVDPPFPTGVPGNIQLNGLTTWPALNGFSFPLGGIEEFDFGSGLKQWVFSTSFTDAQILQSPPQPIPSVVIGTPAPESGTLTFISAAPPAVAGGFRAQIFDTRKSLRMADRGLRVANLGGDTHGVHWLRDPYRFDQPDSQVLLIVQNLENQPNEIQIALYGQVLRFNQQPGTN